MNAFLFNIWRKLHRPHKHKWTIIKTIWPYEGGWGTYCRKCDTVLDTGQSREDAIRLAETENEIQRRRKNRN